MELRSPAGTLRITPAGLYAELCFLGPLRGVSRLVLVGRCGELSLGVPVPAGERLHLRKKLPLSALKALGELSGFVLRPIGEEAYPIGPDGAVPFVERFRQGRLEDRDGVLTIVFSDRTAP